jgi:hypothetical protein
MGVRCDRWPGLLAGPRRRALAVAGVSAVIASACATAASDPPVPRTGAAIDGIRLVLSTGAAATGQVVTARLTGNGVGGGSSSGLVEVTCGVKDTRVSHPVQGVSGAGPPPSGRAPVDQPFDLPAGATVRFTVPRVPTGVCVVSRAVRIGTTVVVARTTLDVH